LGKEREKSSEGEVFERGRGFCDRPQRGEEPGKASSHEKKKKFRMRGYEKKLRTERHSGGGDTNKGTLPRNIKRGGESQKAKKKDFREAAES